MLIDGSRPSFVTASVGIYAADGQRTGAFTIAGGSGDGQALFPTDLAVDGSGNIYVADNGNSRVLKFTSAGTFVAKWGSNGTGNGQFSSISEIAVDASGNVYVADNGNSRVQKFTSAGTFVAKWGSNGTGNGHFSSITGIAVDAGNVYVADSGNRRVQKFTTTGTFLTAWGTNGTATGQFGSMGGVEVDPNGNVYVADSGNRRVQKFTTTGTFLTAWGTNGTADGQFSSVDAIAADANGNVYVADVTNFRVSKFGPDTVAPTIDLRTPPNSAVFDGNEVVIADYSCADQTGGSGIATCIGNVADGARIPTGTIGSHDFTVTATDRAGNTTTVTHTYTVEDVAGPTVELRTPLDGATFFRHQVVAADYSCADEVGGSGLATCGGTVTDGSAIDTSSLGSHQFAVTATDDAGNTTQVAHTYTVVDGTDPTVDLFTPPDGGVYARNQVVAADYSCTDETGGSGINSCIGDAANGSAITTAALGDHDFTVSATDNAGNTTEVTHTYTVEDVTDPAVNLATPPDGAVYARDQVVNADYSCTDETGGSGINSCIGDAANGSAITTAALGDHDFTVSATDNAGNTTEVTHTYTVEDVTDPAVNLITPPQGAVYLSNQVVVADYSCTDETGGSGITSCAGPVEDGAPINTSNAGDHDITVTATDAAGNTTSVTHTYTVVDPLPDGRIRRATGTYAGDGIYNTTGTGQTRTGSAARGGTVTYLVSVQNDAPLPDALRLRGTATTSRFRVRYSTGGFDITSQVAAGTYVTPALVPGAAVVVKVEVKVKSSAPIGSSLTGTVTTRSTTDLTRQDKVKFVTSRR